MMWQLDNYRTLCLKRSKIRREVKENNFGRPINSVAMNLHVEFLIIMNNHHLIIMEAALEHLEKTLSEIAHDV